MYSAPELLHGDTYEATAVDVWASGVLLVVSLLGAFPWVCASPRPFSVTHRRHLVMRLQLDAFHLPLYRMCLVRERATRDKSQTRSGACCGHVSP